MTSLSKLGYVEHKEVRGGKRDWYLIKPDKNGKCVISIGNLNLPPLYAGKKVRVRVDIILQERN